MARLCEVMTALWASKPWPLKRFLFDWHPQDRRPVNVAEKVKAVFKTLAALSKRSPKAKEKR